MILESKTYDSRSEEETIAVAREFALRLKAGHRVALRGELGAGKTCFAKGIIAQWTNTDCNQITSPTFTFIEEYGGPVKVYHLDLYRVSRPQEADGLPWDEIFGLGVLTLVEWPENVEALLENCHFEVKLSKLDSRGRKIEILRKEVL